MKTSFKLALCVLLGISTNAFAADCSALKACDKKVCEINKQLSMAKSDNNQHKVDGLNKALKYTTEYCTVGGLRDDIQDKIDDAMEDIEDYKSDLSEAESENKMNKVQKYERKIKQENDKISMLKLELADLE
ncbi:DUF1090 domain-containing protein [Moritella sp. Urea-trap-13]|uniref:DUF1090 domain-containing protein n=1 Tax=Moritella sp. Urea-trap-13 TaxID=2058327 RepID=UPI000C33397E|nr:DUF1090 domain-containing protein [Moritella sp. Urea-trap-13]PKH06729.1 DUF1090 domain-containing protein [Moritella sp. Urea-trap-13]